MKGLVVRMLAYFATGALIVLVAGILITLLQRLDTMNGGV